MSRIDLKLAILFFNKVYVFRFETLKLMSRIEFDLESNLESFFQVRVYVFRFGSLKLMSQIESKFSKPSTIYIMAIGF